MLNSLRLQASKPGIVLLYPKNEAFAANNIHPSQFSLFSRRERPTLPSCSLSFTPQQSPSDSPPQPQPSLLTFTAVASSPPLPLSHWSLSQRHLILLNVFACVSAICATWLFCSAIPTLLAFKRAAESLEKLMDTTREELPDTMAAIRLSGMEISDLTTELSDLGQEITQGVRSSTRAVRSAEQRLRQLSMMPPPPSAYLQAMAAASPEAEADPGGPAVARTARGVREGIVKGRSILQMVLTLSTFSRFALNYITGRR